jgi:hypothetical protein
VAEITRTE